MKLGLQKKTKIVATISDINCEVEFMQSLYEAGMNVVRINTAHQTVESSQKIVDNIRKISTKIGILVDTKGPEIRTTAMVDEFKNGLAIAQGQTVKIGGSMEKLSDSSILYVNYNNFVADVPVGASILINDGELKLLVTDKSKDYLTCLAQNDTTLKGKKTVNVPDISMKLPSLNKKDVEYISWAIENNIDFVAHSFVRNKEDVMAVMNIINERKSHLKLISKIENQEGVDNIDEILENSYGIMIARGDLGVEIQAERIPGIQKTLVDKAARFGKPAIVATQMLHTMIDNPRPTRAEVTDVANAIYQRADAIMLSGETAFGKYPLEAVSMMTKIAIETEKHLKARSNNHLVRELNDHVAISMAKAAVQVSQEIEDTKAFITDSYSGRFPRYLSGFRSNSPIFALCYLDYVIRELSLSYGVYCYPAQALKSNDEFSRYATRFLRDNSCITDNDRVIILAGNYTADGATTYMEIGAVSNLLSQVNQEVYHSL
ncbi:MAG: pyruvate kinase [Prevotellaceae bacterium]|jgi:pyruvate kinase|nr:pyruvate kinase [Prevotellaceae bacterium]